ncbi:MAG: glycosyltransferase [Acetobacteraceae bacterium]|nr:glycosyltransferase [Acetobacteraceae bacterium]
MPSLPCVDVNLFVYNGAEFVADAIDSVLGQTWPSIRLTLIDDGSNDGTLAVLEEYAQRHSHIRIKRNRCNGGAIANFQRAFWFGDSDYVLPKSADDLLAPDFIAQIMDVLLANAGCAMCHAAGVVFSSQGQHEAYPPDHCLSAIGDNAFDRARHVMQRYTSSPSFWGIYRRDAADRLAPIRYLAGWDHALLAELALYGEIRHVPELLYWRRDGGKPVLRLARDATETGCRRLGLDLPLADQRWRTPLITTAYAHLETFSLARLPEAERRLLMQQVPAIFRARWLPWMRQEVSALRADLPGMIAGFYSAPSLEAYWIARALTELLRTVEAILPEEDFTPVHTQIAVAARQNMGQEIVR